MAQEYGVVRDVGEETDETYSQNKLVRHVITFYKYLYKISQIDKNKSKNKYLV